MRRRAIKVVSGLFGTCLMLAMLMIAIQTAQATPKIANGRPCGTCHTGSPPGKGNVKH